MANLKLVKSATALVLGASVLTSAVAVSGTDASAKTTYKVTKGGYLVYAKSNNKVSGYKSYNGKLYKNGKKFTGLYKNKYYKSGSKATGTYKSKYYKAGTLFTGKTASGIYYVKGVKYTGTTKYGYYYKKGVRFTGVTSYGNQYVNGKRVTGEYKGLIYSNGKKVTGLYKEKLYTEGKLETGLDLYKDKLYKDGVLNIGLALHEGKLYKDADLNKGLEKHEDKYYFDADLANDTYTVDGVEKAFEDGVEVGAKVKSVEAINATQLKVTFNKSVDEDTLGTYSLSDGKTVTDSELLEDGRTVVLTLSSAFDNTKEHSVVVTVKNAKLAGTVDTYFGLYTQVVKVQDTTKADIDSVVAKTNGESVSTFTINLTEPVQSGYSVKVNNEAASSAILSADKKSITVTASSALKVGETHKVDIVNLTDAAGNVNSVVTKSFTVTKDAVAPSVASVEAYGDNQVLVTFDKKMKPSTLTTTNINVKNDQLGDVTGANVTALPNDTTGTKFLVDVDASGLFTSSKTSHNLTVLFKADSIEDSLGNKLPTTTKSVTLTKDTVAPEVTGSKVVKNAAGEVVAIELTFSEGLAAKASVAFPSTVVDENGVVQQSSAIFGTFKTTAVAKGAKTVKFELNTAKEISGKYSVDFAKGLVTDNASGTPNDSKAYSTVLDFGAATSVSEYTIDATKVTNPSANVIKVVFPQAVKGGKVVGSATDASNYTINGAALPEGTTITLNAAYTDGSGNAVAAQTEATITLPAGSVSKTDTAAIFTINKVQSLTGKVNKSFTKTLKVTDNVEPVLANAQLLADGQTFILTYNENLGTVATDLGDQFKFTVDGKDFTLADAKFVKQSVSGKQLIVKAIDTVSNNDAVTSTATVSGTTKVTVPAAVNATNGGTFNVEVKNDAVDPANDPEVLNVYLDNVKLGALGTTITVDGVALNQTGLAAGDKFTVTTVKGSAATTTPFKFDTAKTITIETTSSNADIKDIENNVQKSAVKLTTTR